MRAPSRTRHPRPAHLDQDLGEELDLTDLLSDSMIAKVQAVPVPLKAPETPFDLGKSLGLDMEPTKPSPPAAATPGGKPAASMHSARI